MKPCAVEECDNQTKRRFYCDKHHKRWKRHGDPRKLLINYDYKTIACSVAKCDRMAEKGMKTENPVCEKHYARMKRLGSYDIPLDRKSKKRNDKKPEKYITILVDGKRIGEHRHIMSQHIGRPLTDEETVHHRNGIRNDNRLENLELWASNHPPGQRTADLLMWAFKTIKQYRDNMWDIMSLEIEIDENDLRADVYISY